MAIPAISQRLPLRVAGGSGAYDVGTDIRNTLDAGDGVIIIRTLLETQREVAIDAFLQTVSADMAKSTQTIDNAFIEAIYKKYVTWKATDVELVTRAVAFKDLGHDVERRFHAFEKAFRDDVVTLLKSRIALLTAKRESREFDEKALDTRIDALNKELHKLTPGAKPPKAAAKKKAKAKRPAVAKKMAAKASSRKRKATKKR